MTPAHSQIEEQVVRLVNADGHSPVVLVCEHATSFIPDFLDNLGLRPEDRHSHAAWDPGALAVAELLSKRLNAKLVASGISRLVYDCNRPLAAVDAMPERSERIAVPGNIGLDEKAREERTQLYYEPFREAVAAAMRATQTPILVTVHSFTPVYEGKQRSVEIGILHDSDSRLADTMLDAAAGSPFDVRRNEPYGPQHGVTHTLKEHAIKDGQANPSGHANSAGHANPAGHANVMIEIRNDLIANEAQQEQIADLLGAWLDVALTNADQHNASQEGAIACAG